MHLVTLLRSPPNASSPPYNPRGPSNLDPFIHSRCIRTAARLNTTLGAHSLVCPAPLSQTPNSRHRASPWRGSSHSIDPSPSGPLIHPTCRVSVFEGERGTAPP